MNAQLTLVFSTQRLFHANDRLGDQGSLCRHFSWLGIVAKLKRGGGWTVLVERSVDSTWEIKQDLRREEKEESEKKRKSVLRKGHKADKDIEIITAGWRERNA
jgi:hypothetical protein